MTITKLLNIEQASAGAISTPQISISKYQRKGCDTGIPHKERHKFHLLLPLLQEPSYFTSLKFSKRFKKKIQEIHRLHFGQATLKVNRTQMIPALSIAKAESHFASEWSNLSLKLMERAVSAFAF